MVLILCVMLTSCPNIWLNIILGVFVRVFLDEVNIFFELVSWGKQIVFLVWMALTQSADRLSGTESSIGEL